MKVSLLRSMAVGATSALALALIAPSANAQAQTEGVRFGVEAAFATKGDIGIGAGAFAKFHLTEISGHPITGRATFDYYFPSTSNFNGFSYKYWELAADGLFDIVADGTTKPYVGAGLTYLNSSFGSGYCGSIPGCSASYSNTGLHAVGGFNFMADSKLMPFVEVKLGLSSGSQLTIKGGIHIK